MLDMEKLAAIRERLNATGRIREVLDDDGLVQPSPTALEWAAREHAGASAAERYGLAQCFTLMELAEKYRREMESPN